MLIILGDLGIKLIVWGLRELCQKVKKKKNSQLKGNASVLFDFLKNIIWLFGWLPPYPPYKM